MKDNKIVLTEFFNRKGYVNVDIEDLEDETYHVRYSTKQAILAGHGGSGTYKVEDGNVEVVKHGGFWMS